MGALDLVSTNVMSPDLLPFGQVPVVVLETGGEPIDTFRFPDSGVLVVGSEELGVRPELLNRSDHRVSIPMRGAKRSLNVGVACAIALYAWQSSVGMV
jgi:TrmH family RNA methyltransferase